jgi:hypothetical protein
MIKLMYKRNEFDSMNMCERRLENDILEIEKFRMTTKCFEILYSDIEKDIERKLFEMFILFTNEHCSYIVKSWR